MPNVPPQKVRLRMRFNSKFCLNDHFDYLHGLRLDDLNYWFYVLISDEVYGPSWVLVNWNQIFDVGDWRLGDYMVFRQDGVNISARVLLLASSLGLSA